MAARPPDHTPPAPRARRALAVTHPYLLAVLDREALPRILGDADQAAAHRDHARADGAELRLRGPALHGHHGPRPLGVGVIDGANLDLGRALDQRDLVGCRAEVRAAVERIDLTGVVKADPPQHALDGARLRTDLPDDLLH